MKQLIDNPRVRSWLAKMGAATLILGTAYVLVQQSTRLAANDMPLSTAQTLSQELADGQAPKDLVPGLKIDVADNGSLFIIITDAEQHILASSASLGGQTPLPPIGVFGYTTVHGSDHFTWQPQPGVRLATEVMTYTTGTTKGFIITGQSLKQAEDRINIYGELAIAGWLATLAWTTAILFWPSSRTRR